MSGEKRKITTIEDLPEVAETVHIQQFLGLSKSAAYDLIKTVSRSQDRSVDESS